VVVGSKSCWVMVDVDAGRGGRVGGDFDREGPAWFSICIMQLFLVHSEISARHVVVRDRVIKGSSGNEV